MSELGANAIRVYHVDPLADHSGCMKAFADAGIYLFVDLDTFHTQIEQVSPVSSPEKDGALTWPVCPAKPPLECNPVCRLPGRAG